MDLIVVVAHCSSWIKLRDNRGWSGGWRAKIGERAQSIWSKTKIQNSKTYFALGGTRGFALSATTNLGVMNLHGSRTLVRTSGSHETGWPKQL
jgi:hypothetical protein